MKDKICMITAATSGIGKATAMALAAMGATTILVGRSENKCIQTVKEIQVATGNSSVFSLLTDLSSQRSIHYLADQFTKQYDHLDILINNAGAKITSRFETVDGLEMTFALNHLAYFMLSHLLLDHLKRSEAGRIINVASGSHGGCLEIDFDDLQSEKAYIGKKAYAQSKLANLLFTYEFARRLEGTHVTVNALEPGGVATNFCRNNGVVSWLKHIVAHILARNLIGPEKGAKTSVYLATSPEVKGISGKYFSQQKMVSSSAASYDKDAAKRLWDVSCELTRIN